MKNEISATSPDNINDALAAGYSVCGIDIDDEYADSIDADSIPDLTIESKDSGNIDG
jgi:hypothetical protein